MTTIRQFQHFLAVMEHGSFMAAAREVNISQPALSKSIATLESAYGAPFFVRRPRGVRPTAFAQAMEYHARRILLDFDQSKREIIAIATGTEGRVRVGAGMDFITCTEQAMSVLSDERPGVDYTVVTDHAEQLRNALLGNRIDLYVGMVNRLIHDDRFDISLVASDRILGICRIDHAFAGKIIGVAKLQQHDWVVPGAQEPARTALESYFYLNQQPLPRFRFVTNTPAIISRYVNERNCLSITPESSIKEYGKSKFAAFYIKDFEFVRSIGIARRANSATTPLLDAFTTTLIEKIVATFPESSSLI